MGDRLNYEGDPRIITAVTAMQLGIVGLILTIADWDNPGRGTLISVIMFLSVLSVVMFIEYIIAGLKVKTAIEQQKAEVLYIWSIRLIYTFVCIKIMEKTILREQMELITKINRYVPYLILSVLIVAGITKLVKRILDKWDKYVYSDKKQT